MKKPTSVVNVGLKLKELSFEVLKLISKGGLTIRDIANKLNVREELIKHAIELLLALGYIKELHIGPQCHEKCNSCPFKAVCPYAKIGVPSKPSVIYVITDRGLRKAREASMK
ncbi:MAG TPA: hypothetical protein ENG05_01280 [Acidilobales archaeon]|nr:hypothetical protein [Acidilobales archaeon]